MALNPSESVDLRMVLLGNAGVGKSSTANAILGREAFRETKTTECEIQTGRVNSRTISVIDTPGINSTALSTDQLKTEIERILSLSAPGPHLFLLVIRVRRFTEDTRNTVKWIQENFGEEALKFTLVLFIGREEMSKRQWVNFSQEPEMLELISKCGFGYDVINNKQEINTAQITKLLEKIETMVQQNMGQHYTPEMYEAVQRKRTIQEKAQEKKREEDEKQEEQESCSQKVKLKEELESGEDEGRPEIEDTEDKIQEVKGATGGILHGPGISASGNTVLGREAFETDLLNSTTKWKRQDGTVGNKTITVIDTKGIPLGANFSWFRELFEESLSMCNPGPHVFLLVIWSPLVVWSQEKIDLLKENFGEEFTKRCIVLLTHGDIHGRERHVLHCFSEFQRLVCSCSGVYHIFDNEEKEDRTQVTELLEKIEAVVEKNGGQHYTTEMFQEAQKKNVKKALDGLESLLDLKMQLMILAMHLEAKSQLAQQELEKICTEEDQLRRREEDNSCHLL